MSKINMPKKEAAKIDYKKVFSDQVRKGFTGDHNMNVAKGAYTMIKGPSAKNIDGTAMHGTIGQMKDKAAYKYGMHGDRNEMGKKAMMQKMKDYFPQQSDYLTEDGRAIDASKPKAQMKEAGEKYTTKTSTTTLDNNKKFTLETVRPHTKTKMVHAGDEYGGNPRFMSSGHGGTMKPVKERVEGSVTYVNPKGKERTAKSGTLKAKALETMYNMRTKQGKFRSTEKYSPKEKVYKFKGGTETITRT